MTSAIIKTQVKGHVLIKDGRTGEVVLNKYNAVHNKNMAIAIARGLANDSAGTIHKIKLGNGGSYVSGTNEIAYQAPNVTGPTADLYNPTYEEIIDDSNGSVPVENSVTYQENADPATTTVVICTATIAAGEPNGQDPSDSPPNPDPEAQFAFDELGLFTTDDKLLTHIVFSPILKTANRELVITYTLTISVS
jgi:hypothetical protein